MDHLGSRTNGPPYVCPLCRKIFMDSSNYSKHISTHVEVNLEKCNDEEFKTRYNLMLHLRLCERSSAQDSPPTPGMKTYMKDTPYNCKVCGQAFKEQKIYFNDKTNINSSNNDNTIVSSNNKTHSCKMCKNLFTPRSNITDKLSLHVGESSLTCPTCLKSLARVGNCALLSEPKESSFKNETPAKKSRFEVEGYVSSSDSNVTEEEDLSNVLSACKKANLPKLDSTDRCSSRLKKTDKRSPSIIKPIYNETKASSMKTSATVSHTPSLVNLFPPMLKSEKILERSISPTPKSSVLHLPGTPFAIEIKEEEDWVFESDNE